MSKILVSLAVVFLAVHLLAIVNGEQFIESLVLIGDRWKLTSNGAAAKASCWKLKLLVM